MLFHISESSIELQVRAAQCISGVVCCTLGQWVIRQSKAEDSVDTKVKGRINPFSAQKNPSDTRWSWYVPAMTSSALFKAELAMTGTYLRLLRIAQIYLL